MEAATTLGVVAGNASVAVFVAGVVVTGAVSLPVTVRRPDVVVGEVMGAAIEVVLDAVIEDVLEEAVVAGVVAVVLATGLGTVLTFVAALDALVPATVAVPELPTEVVAASSVVVCESVEPPPHALIAAVAKAMAKPVATREERLLWDMRLSLGQDQGLRCKGYLQSVGGGHEGDIW